MKTFKSKKTESGRSPVSRKNPAKGQAPRRKPAPRKKAVRAEVPAAPAENPRARSLASRIAALALDKKALDVVVIDVRGKSSYADYLVIASGESERQVSAMAEHVEISLKAEGSRSTGAEGTDTGHWVVLDYGEVVAHLFSTEVRAFYDLEGLWADAVKERVA